MKNDKTLWGSISILIGIVIAILALARGPWQIWLLTGAFILWGLWVTLFLLHPMMQREKRRRQRLQQMKKRQAEGISSPKAFSVPEITGDATELLLRHVNHRISSYLRGAYPDVKWEWCEKNPEKLILQGGVGRIRVFGIVDFDHADIKLDQNANLRCDMVKIVPLPGNDESNSGNTPPNKQPVDPQIWYEVQGRSVLEAMVADLNSRGHSRLTLHEDGDICIVEDKDEVAKDRLSNFLEKVYWPRLVQVLESNGLAAEITAAGIQVSW